MIDAIVVLAGGNGTRMLGGKPKLIRELCGQPIICKVLDNLPQDIPTSVVCSNELKIFLEEELTLQQNIKITAQGNRRGTGAAAADGFECLQHKNGIIAIVYGDTPFMPFSKIEEAARLLKSNFNMAVVGFECKSTNNSYGKLIIENDIVYRVEESDNDDGNKVGAKGMLCNSGIVVAKATLLERFFSNLETIKKEHGSKEYRLTDLVTFSNNSCTFVISTEEEARGINSLLDLTMAERQFSMQLCERAMQGGALILNPSNTYLHYNTKLHSGCIINAGVVFGSNVIINADCVVEHYVKLESCTIGANSVIGHCTVIEDSNIGENNNIKAFSFINGLHSSINVQVGPFARIRKNTFLNSDTLIGNFVEVKNSKIGHKTKSSHLSYIGDSDIGDNVNFGAGSITCNYDGFKKHKTTVGNNVFVGSSTIFIAPTEVEDGAIIGAGTTINSKIEKDSIVVQERNNKISLNAATRYRKMKSEGND